MRFFQTMTTAERDFKTFNIIFPPLKDEIINKVKIIKEIGRSTAVVSRVEMPSPHQEKTIEAAMKVVTFNSIQEQKRLLREIGMTR